MIKNIGAKNFKSWKDTGDIRVAPITGFFGTNSSGKTSLVQMLLLMKQTAQSSDPKQVFFFGDDFSLVNLGTFNDVIFAHEIDRNLQFSISWESEEPFFFTRHLEDTARNKSHLIRFTTSVRQENERLTLDFFRYEIDQYFVEVRKVKEENDYVILFSDQLEIRNMSPVTRGRAVPVKFYLFPWGDILAKKLDTDDVSNSERFVLSGYMLETLLESIAYLGPLRDHPRRSYVWGGDSPSDMGQRGERTVAALLSMRSESGGNYLEEKIAYWLKRMGLIHSFKLRPIAPGRRDYEVIVKKTPSSAEVLITDIGFGVSQLLPVLVLCYYVPESSIIILEQPEIHLHPSVQADLADVFIEVAKERNIQIIFESHSEYLLHRFQRRIAEEKLTKEDTSLYFCSMGEEASEIEELQLDEYGNIANWPRDFFGDATGDLVAMTEAAMKRKLVE